MSQRTITWSGSTLWSRAAAIWASREELVEYLLDGLRPLESKILDAASGGTVMNLTSRQVRQLIREIAESDRFREKTTPRDDTGKTRNVLQVEHNNNQLANELIELTEMMHKMMVVQLNDIKVCELCDSASHKIVECPTLQNDDIVDVNAMGRFHKFNNNEPSKYRLRANGYS